MSDEEKKVSFDARMQYYDAMKSALLLKIEAASTNDLTRWYRAVQELGVMVMAYIKKEDYEKIKTELGEVRKLIFSNFGGRAAPFVQMKIERHICAAEELIHMAADSLFLPVGGEESDEVDWERLKRQ